MKVLVADDNEDASGSLSMALTFSGHETRVANDGEQAFALAQEFRPDVMLLDISMPLLDGHALARRIRAQPWGRGVLLIAVSGWGQAEDARRSREAGFDHHLVKPLEFEKVNKLLAQRPS
ncbi:MAG: response regulator [Archangium sp.]|nr:response regulator [Archangium sp.]MDP3153934.1 response regulator [Archangium sp.]MDP3575120.1 response regulator [Archangium sp.]